ncbi:hypothetical protein FQN55_002484, partial [Onygenales sp. PD_40]
MPSFKEKIDALEREGVYIGGWGFKDLYKPSKNADGEYDTSKDHIEQLNGVEANWTAKEERALQRKLDMRVLFPACVIYFLDRSNLANVKIIQLETEDSFEESLNLVGIDFNW